MKQIPIKKFDGSIIIDLYCENCDESLTLYPDRGEVKFKKDMVF